MTTDDFKRMISEGIPETLPDPKTYDPSQNHAPKRKDILNPQEKKLAIKNALLVPGRSSRLRGSAVTAGKPSLNSISHSYLRLELS